MNSYLDFFHSLEQFGIRPGLNRMKGLADLLGNPQDSLSFIHVAGTNGKGSICTFLAEILKAAGYKTGLYISPYVVDFRERIQINSQMIGADILEQAANQVRAAVMRLNERNIIISEFEALTAAAFLCYKNAGCDFIVLETGLGGRFDATNIIKKPLLSLISSISLDHVKILGNSLAEIAFEKCGIIKEGCPVITNDNQNAEALNVIKNVSKERNAPLFIAKTKALKAKESSIFGSKIDYDGMELDIPLAGEHQLENAITAIEAARVLASLNVKLSNDAIIKGIASAKIPARVEILSKNPLIILDGSHNDGSTQALASYLIKHFKDKKLLGLMGMMKDKDCKKAIANLAPHFSYITTTCPSNERAIDAEELAGIIRSSGFKAEAAGKPENALKHASALLNDYDALIICGSLYLAGDILNAELAKYYQKKNSLQ